MRLALPTWSSCVVNDVSSSVFIIAPAIRPGVCRGGSGTDLAGSRTTLDPLAAAIACRLPGSVGDIANRPPPDPTALFYAPQRLWPSALSAIPRGRHLRSAARIGSCEGRRLRLGSRCSQYASTRLALLHIQPMKNGCRLLSHLSKSQCAN